LDVLVFRKVAYIIPRGHIVILNVNASAEDETDAVKDSLYEELEYVFDEFQRYRTEILRGDFFG
jgi:hypothetical protein